MARSAAVKWARVGHALPAWLLVLLLTLVRATALIVYGVLLLAVATLDYVADPVRDLRKFVQNNLLSPLTSAIQTVVTVLWLPVFIYFLPWLAAGWLAELWIHTLWDTTWFLLRVWRAVDLLGWDIYWLFAELIWEHLAGPIVGFVSKVVLYVPNLGLALWGSFISTLFKPFDDFCAWIFKLFDDTADVLLAAVRFPTWQASWLDVPIALPLLAANDWFEAQSGFLL